jgi:hypothetical protein
LLNQGKILGYTRLRIEGHLCGGTARNYGSETRAWLKRVFAGKSADKKLTLDLTISTYSTPATKILAEINRKSNSKGEMWSTTIDQGDIPFPYFRIDSSSSVVLSAKVKSTREYSLGFGGNAISLLQQATSFIAPPVPLLTKLTSDQLKNAATLANQAISSSLSVTIDETPSREVVLNPQSTGQVLAIYSLKLPPANDAYALPGADQPVGVWAVIAEPIRMSMFGEPASGVLDSKTLSPADILGFAMSDQKTLRDTLNGTATITASRDELVKATTTKGGKVNEQAYKLCRLIAASAEEHGLTAIDGGAAAWAYIKEMALASTAEGTALSGCNGLNTLPKPLS